MSQQAEPSSPPPPMEEAPFAQIHLDAIWDIQFLYEITTLLLYIYILYIVISSKKPIFRSAFYILFIFGGLIDVTLAATHASYRFAKRIGLCYEWVVLWKIQYFIINSFYFIHIFVNILMTANQLTVVIRPLKHTQIWHKRHYLPILLICILFSLGCHIHFLIIERKFTITSGFCSSKTDYGIMGIVTAVLVFTFEFNCCIVGPLAVHKAMKMRKSNSRTLKQETSAFFTVIRGICYFCEATYEIVSALNISTQGHWLLAFISTNIYAYFYLLIILNGPVLLALSTALRKEIKSRWVHVPDKPSSLSKGTGASIVNHHHKPPLHRQQVTVL